MTRRDVAEMVSTVAAALWMGVMFYVFTVIMFCF